jgi:hypothetical protein
MMRGRRFIAICGAIVLLAVAMQPGAAFATWSSYNYDTADGPRYGIHEGGNYIQLGLKTEKEARKTASKINKVLAKDGGFVDPGSGPCHDPKPGTQC